MGGGEHEERPLSVADLEISTHRAVIAVPTSGIPGTDRHRAAPARGDRERRARLHARGREAVAEARLDGPAHVDGPRQALHAPHQLTRRPQRHTGKCHRIRHPHHAPCRRERRLEDIRTGEIAATGVVGTVRGEREAAAPVGVEKAGKHAWRVEVGQAQPVDHAVPGDEGHRPPIADHRVIPDGGVGR